MINAAAHYRRVLKKELRCGGKAKKRLLNGFDQILNAYLEEHNNTTVDELTFAFGPPKEMAAVLMSEITAPERVMHRRKRLCIKIATGFLIAFGVFFTLYIWLFKNVGLTSTNELTDTPLDWAETYNSTREDYTT